MLYHSRTDCNKQGLCYCRILQSVHVSRPNAFCVYPMPFVDIQMLQESCTDFCRSLQCRDMPKQCQGVPARIMTLAGLLIADT